MAAFEIVEYTKRNLKELLENERFWLQPQLPITKLRAMSHAFNPRADDSDTVLITAVKDGHLLAYLGILPDLLLTQCGGSVKFGWLTTWWVDKTSGNRHAAAILLLSAIRGYSNRLAASFPSIDAKRIYDATKRFQHWAKLSRAYFILALPPSIRVLSSFSTLLVGVRNRMIYGRKLQSRGLELRTADALDDSLALFINTWACDDPFVRDASYWRWVLSFPWLSANPQDENISTKYAFSVFAGDFKQIPLVVSRHGVIIAFLVMTLRNARLCLKYAYYDACDGDDVATALLAFVPVVKPWVFICADAILNRFLKRGFLFYGATFSKTSEIYAMEALPFRAGMKLQFGTGDVVFT